MKKLILTPNHDGKSQDARCSVVSAAWLDPAHKFAGTLSISAKVVTPKRVTRPFPGRDYSTDSQ